MPLLIDGYNVMHIVGIIGRGVGPGGLRRSRLALLNFLAESLPPREVSHTTVVFDARDAPPGLPRVVDHRGIAVNFAAPHGDADVMIEELIRAHSSPRRLTVVSSDHRIQRAARRRKATTIDADVWYAEVVRRRRQRRQAASEGSARPPVPLLEEDIDYWIRQFGGESLLAELNDLEASQSDEADSPFPPGYGEDLEE